MYVIIIQARMGSTRLPGKIMKKLLNKEIILWGYDRCKKSIADDVFIATSTNTENDILEKLCEEHKIKYFRGSECDLLDRYYQLCQKYNLNKDDTKIIRVTSDCPFVDTNIINDMIKFYEENDYDYIINHSDEGITLEGSGIEIINYKSLEYLWKNETDMSIREHATGLLSKLNIYNDKIKIKNYIYAPEGLDIEKNKFVKISVDTKEDYEKSIQIVNYFNNYDFSYYDILTFLNNQ